jgi:hypothetical protein
MTRLKSKALTLSGIWRKNCSNLFMSKVSILLLLVASLLLTSGNVKAVNPTDFVYGNNADLSNPAAYIGGAYPLPTQDVGWYKHASGIYNGGVGLQDSFTFNTSTANNFTSLTLTSWDNDVTISGANITLTGANNQINTGSSNNMIINNNLIVDSGTNVESWTLTDELTLNGTVTSGTGLQTVTINGAGQAFVSLDMNGSSNDPNVSFALNGVQVVISNAETFGNLSLIQSSTVALGGITSSKVIQFDGGFSPGSSTLTITGWQGQIGNSGGGVDAKLYFANTIPGVTPYAPTTPLYGIVFDVVFDLSTNTNGSSFIGQSVGGGPAIPNFYGFATGNPDQPTMNSNDDFGEWIIGPSGFAELVPYFGAVPEPKTVIAGLALLGLLAWRERRRLGAFCAELFPSP